MGFHLVNVLLHALNALLAWLLLRRLGLRWAWLAAAVFALHPVHVESVAWISERKNVLSGLFFLFAIAGYFRYEDEGGLAWYGASLTAFALSLLSKPVTATLPVILPLLSWARGKKFDRRALAGLLPFLALSLGAGIFTILAETDVVGVEMKRTIFHFSSAQHLLWACRALWFYPLKLIWPVNLAFSYGRWSLDPREAAQWLWVLAAFGAGGLGWLFKDRMGRGAWAGLGFYAVTIAPMLGLASLYTLRFALVADHYQYLASLGLIAVGAGGLSRLIREGKAAMVFGAVLLAVLGIGTWRQGRIYANDKVLWTDTLRKSPGAAIAHTNLGGILFAEGKFEAAIGHYREAQRLEPDNLEALQDLGEVYSKIGKLEEAKACYQEAIRLQPEFYPARLSLGNVLQAEGRWNEAIASYREALRIHPDYAGAFYDLGNVYYQLRRLEEARGLFENAIRLQPELFLAQNNLGNVLQDEGKLDEAVARYKDALRLKPDYAEAYVNLGNAFFKQNRKDQARQAYESAIRLKPDLAAAHANLGVLLSFRRR